VMEDVEESPSLPTALDNRLQQMTGAAETAARVPSHLAPPRSLATPHTTSHQRRKTSPRL
jgi:hypothetical protein